MKVLVVSIPGLGNTIVTIPLLQILKEKKKAEVSVVVKMHTSHEVLKNNQYVDHLYKIPKKGLLKFLFKLRKENFDYVITSFPANDLRYNIFSFILGKKRRISHKYLKKNFKTLSFLQTDFVDIKGVHDIEQNINLAKPLGIHVKNREINPFINITKDEEKEAEAFLKKNNLKEKDFIVGIHPGCSIAHGMISKRWQKEKFVEVIKWLNKKKIKVMVFAGPDETEIADKIEELSKVKITKVINLPIRVVTALTKKCNLFVSNDSGIMNIASAMDVPIICIMCPTDPMRSCPYNKTDIVVRDNLECSPCSHIFSNLGFKFKCKYDQFHCRENIMPEHVTEAIKRKLNEIKN